MKLLSKSISLRSPAVGQTAYESSYYTRVAGGEKARVRFIDISDDVFDHHTLEHSADHGQTWGPPRSVEPAQKVPGGTVRQFENSTFIDPRHDRLVQTYCRGVLRNDNAADGFTAYSLRYRVSTDAGRTSVVDLPVAAPGYHPDHPFDHVWIGKNAFMNGSASSMLALPDGSLIMAVPTTLVDEKGEVFNPGGGYGWLEVFVVHGKWRSDLTIEWTPAQRIPITPDKSTRGIYEPALAHATDGRILMVSRASNGGPKDPQFKIPSFKWACVSNDHGKTWSAPEPWKYTDGSPVVSSSSISQFVPLSSGKLLWIGNLTDGPCHGNLPRDPLHFALVDKKSMRLIRDSVFVADRSEPGEPQMQLSNFLAHEDRRDGTLILHMTRFMEQKPGVWGGDAYVYRFEV